MQSTTVLDDTWQETRFETSVKMSSYLVCFIVCDFKYKSNTVSNNGIEVSSGSQRSVQGHRGQFKVIGVSSMS